MYWSIKLKTSTINLPRLPVCYGKVQIVNCLVNRYGSCLKSDRIIKIELDFEFWREGKRFWRTTTQTMNYYDPATAAAYAQAAAIAVAAAGASSAPAAPVEDDSGEDEEIIDSRGNKRSNILPIWGNTSNMNLNPLIMTNIQGSPYFKVNLLSFKVSYTNVPTPTKLGIQITSFVLF